MRKETYNAQRTTNNVFYLNPHTANSFATSTIKAIIPKSGSSKKVSPTIKKTINKRTPIPTTTPIKTGKALIAIYKRNSAPIIARNSVTFSTSLSLFYHFLEILYLSDF